MHDTVFDWPTAPMYQPVPDCHTACGKLQTTLCTPSCGWAGWQRPCGAALSFAIMLQRLPVKLRLIGYSCVIISDWQLAHFTNLERFKFPYENCLVDISRESYDNLVCERYPSKY